MKRLLIFFGIAIFCQFLANPALAQRNYKTQYIGGITGGTGVSGKWYKLATINMGCTHNSVQIEANVSVVNTSKRYSANAWMRFRNGSAEDWQYEQRGLDREFLKLKKLADKQFELIFFMTGNYTHTATELLVTSECGVTVTMIDQLVEVDPFQYPDVQFSGDLVIPGGKVAIGTHSFKSGDYKLYVDGGIRAREVKVDALSWADFVFKPSYQLRPLEEVESFIEANGHLPEIPSEEEVKANGVNIGEMDAKLLQKIEELTLYMIELKKENLEMKEEIRELKSRSK